MKVLLGYFCNVLWFKGKVDNVYQSGYQGKVSNVLWLLGYQGNVCSLKK